MKWLIALSTLMYASGSVAITDSPSLIDMKLIVSRTKSSSPVCFLCDDVIDKKEFSIKEFRLYVPKVAL